MMENGLKLINLFRLIGETTLMVSVKGLSLISPEMFYEIFKFFFLYLAESRILQNLDQGLLWKPEMEPLKRKSSVTVNTHAA